MLEFKNNLFLAAIEKDQKESWRLEVYLVNQTNHQYKVKIKQGSFSGDEDGLLDLGLGMKEDFVLKSKSFYMIDKMTDSGELDFSTYYHLFLLDENNNLLKIWGEFTSGSFFREKKFVPALNEMGIIENLSQLK